MRLIKLNRNNLLKVIGEVLKILRNDGLVIFPSDTVYGALVDATNEKAVKKLIEFKNRPPGKAISIFVSGFKMLKHQVSISNQQSAIISQILPGPFTVILNSRHNVVKLLESEKGTLGVRIPMYRYIEVLTKKFRKPITATSANLAGRTPHYSIKRLLNELPEKKKLLIDLIVDTGKLPKNKPSTVVDLTSSAVRILRKGEMSFLETNKFISESVEGTRKIAKELINKIKKSNKPLVFIIEGDLGVGKTVFVKGLGESFGIKNIISPTYVIYYEYGSFYHFDLYQIEEKDEFRHLGIEELLKPGNILCFEWGEKAGEIYELLKSKAKIVHVKMKYLNESKREIEIKL